jgi:predicted AAA+ superfamily ATPase
MKIDFLVTNKGTKAKRLIQVSYDMADAKTRKRKFSALLDARNETGIEDCSVVTWDAEGEEHGVGIVPAWKWFRG